MAQINIDEKACRGCELCVDECPTKVFEYDAENNLPVIARKDDCIECLSCYYICPSTAIGLEDVEISGEFYRDLSIQERIKKFLLARDPYMGRELIAHDYEQALKDMFVRIQAMSDVYHHIAGKSLPALGTSAGQVMARQFPAVKPINTIEDALKALQVELNPAWVFSFDLANNGSSLKIKIEDCFVRESCQFLERPLGENLCVLFGGYMMGYLFARISQRLKIMNVNPGSSCTYEIKIFS
ncbi:MAG: ferredoxin family protein [Candidatus Aminicenantes bacterium]|nr:MAG: ferredoxin family protein [Candidatus Aminicenantes bacterium]